MSRHTLATPLSIDHRQGTRENCRHVPGGAIAIDATTVGRVVRRRCEDRATHREDKGHGKTCIHTRGTRASYVIFT